MKTAWTSTGWGSGIVCVKRNMTCACVCVLWLYVCVCACVYCCVPVQPQSSPSTQLRSIQVLSTCLLARRSESEHWSSHPAPRSSRTHMPRGQTPGRVGETEQSDGGGAADTARHSRRRAAELRQSSRATVRQSGGRPAARAPAERHSLTQYTIMHSTLIHISQHIYYVLCLSLTLWCPFVWMWAVSHRNSITMTHIILQSNINSA